MKNVVNEYMIINAADDALNLMEEPITLPIIKKIVKILNAEADKYEDYGENEFEDANYYVEAIQTVSMIMQGFKAILETDKTKTMLVKRHWKRVRLMLCSIVIRHPECINKVG